MTTVLDKQDTATAEQADTVQGLVKWFDPSKGFGFVVADNGGADILLHVNVLRSFGQSSVADGARVEIKVQQTDRGAQAAQVLSVTPPADLPPVVIERAGFDAETLAQTDLKPARVKWFDKTKGFGFANVFGCYEDVFLHIDVLRQSGLADPQSGEALAMRVVNGERGYLAAEVRAWETVVRED
ncbi:cold shock domain-containing protein [Sulfitobacter sp. S0837]|uniref:cold shock domain-containing protein n=1 Tax=Sulfitobacter maritimus TaxID=2741719 RepID=UPI001582E07E|nr:cold shock domain-containing protein [Sulfitobacter maritimus]NUH64473.1 cold shock domain-containing protein [Sulfitobacter maritimus]